MQCQKTNREKAMKKKERNLRVDKNGVFHTPPTARAHIYNCYNAEDIPTGTPNGIPS